MADSFWAQAEEYKKSKERYKDLLFQKATSLANNDSKTFNDSKAKDAPPEKVNDEASAETTAAMAAHSLEEADATKKEQEVALDEREPLKILRFSPSGLKSDELPPFDLKRVTDIVKKMREDSEKGKSKVKKSEWEKIDKHLGLWK
ncbi:hypothetical protein MMC30_000942 [Trapelia coarctata]|nr:hypothetical protein [Trapelia coarctata]